MSNPARIESWLIVQTGARLTSDGHLTVENDATGFTYNVQLEADVYSKFTLAAGQLKTALNTNTVGLAFDVTTSGDTITITSNPSCTLTWNDTDARAYFGFASTTYATFLSLTSDADPTGRITLNGGLVPEFFDLLIRQHSPGHNGVTLGTFLAMQQGCTFTGTVIDSEIEHLVSVLSRFQAGIPGSVWLDGTNDANFDFATDEWTGIRHMALYDPHSELDLANWLAPPICIFRKVSFKMLEVSAP